MGAKVERSRIHNYETFTVGHRSQELKKLEQGLATLSPRPDAERQAAGQAQTREDVLSDLLRAHSPVLYRVFEYVLAQHGGETILELTQKDAAKLVRPEDGAFLEHVRSQLPAFAEALDALSRGEPAQPPDVLGTAPPLPPDAPPDLADARELAWNTLANLGLATLQAGKLKALVKPLPEDTLDGVLGLIGPLASVPEERLLHHLHDAQLLPEARWEKDVVPLLERSAEARSEPSRFLKTAVFANKWGPRFITPIAVIAAQLTGIPLEAVVLPSVGASILYSEKMRSRTGAMLEVKKDLTGDMSGAPVLELTERESAAMVFLQRLSQGDFLAVPDASLAQSILQEGKVLDLVADSTWGHALGQGETGSPSERALEAGFVATAIDAGAALVPLREAAEAGAPPEELRALALKLRGEALDPTKLEPNLQRFALEVVEESVRAYTLGFARYGVQAARQLEAALAPDSGSTPEQIQALAAEVRGLVLQGAKRLRQAMPKHLGRDLKALVEDPAATLETQRASLRAQVGKFLEAAPAALSQLETSEKLLKPTLDALVLALDHEVLGRLNGLEPQLKVKRLDLNGDTVTAQLHTSSVFQDNGRIEVPLADGDLDLSRLRVDLGDDVLAGIGERALDKALAVSGSEEVAVQAFVEGRRERFEPATVVGRSSGGEVLSVRVHSSGLVDWASASV